MAALTLGASACDWPTDPVPPDPPSQTPPPPIAFPDPAAIDVLDLGPGVAKGINNRGHVAGTSGGQAFFWSSTTGLVGLGTTGGTESDGRDINVVDVVVGVSGVPGSGGEAFQWSSSTGMVGLGTFGGMESIANAINDQGEIVGSYVPAFDPADTSTFRGIQSYRWSAAAGFHELPTLGDPRFGVATDINDVGQIVGVSKRSADPMEYQVSYVWTPGFGTQGLGDVSPDHSEQDVFGINEAGEVAGSALNETTGLYDPFIRTGGGFTNLRSRGLPVGAMGTAVEVNLDGYVAASVLMPDGSRTPGMWCPGLGFVPFPTLGGISGEVLSLNDRGQAVGWSEDVSGTVRATLWTLRLSPIERIEGVVAALEDLMPVESRAVRRQLARAVAELYVSLGELGATPPAVSDGVDELDDAAFRIQQAVGRGLDPSLGDELNGILADAAGDLAVQAVLDAIDRGGRQRRINRALDRLDRGNAALAAGDFRGAIQWYADAADQAERA